MNLKINFTDYSNFLYDRIKISLGHAYPNGKLKEEHIHTALEGVKATMDINKLLLSEIKININKEDEKSLELLLSLNNIALDRIKRSYPNGTLDEWVTTHANLTSLYDTRTAIKNCVDILGFKQAEVDLLRLCNSLYNHDYIYRYVVSNDKIKQENLHAACQISMIRLHSIIHIIENAYNNNQDHPQASFVKKILDQSKSTLKGFNEAYPNGYYSSDVGWTVFKISHGRINEIRKLIEDSKYYFNNEETKKEVNIKEDNKPKGAVNYSI